MKLLMLLSAGLALAFVSNAIPTGKVAETEPASRERLEWAIHDVGWATIQTPSDWKAGESCGPGSKIQCDPCVIAHSDWKNRGGERFSLMVNLTCGIGGSAIWKVSRRADRLYVDTAPPPGKCIYDEGGEEVDCSPAKYIITGAVEVDGHWITFVYTGSQRTEAAYAECRKLIEGVRLKLQQLPKEK
jgi:hypothetical protein